MRSPAHKLNYCGINGPLLAWFDNYLSDRRQREILPNGNSDLKEIKAGVPNTIVYHLY